MALQVIGAGYGRTGTASLKLALEKLGFGPCYHMTEVLPHPERVEQWTQVARGNADWDSIFSSYQACVDFPACTYYEQLATHYPDAKVILTTRDPSKWYDSLVETIMKPKLLNVMQGTPISEMVDQNVWSQFDGRLDDREHMMRRFDEHHAQVKSRIPKNRLLVFEAKMGWGPLCSFLEVAVPEEPYPHVNSKQETAKLFDQMIAQAEAKGSTTSFGENIDQMYNRTDS